MRRFLLRDPLIFLLILFILTAAAGLAAAEIQYEDYRQKIEIISELVAAEMSAEEWNSPDESPEHPVLTEAVQLLKGHGEEHVRGRKILSSYGYSDGIFTGWAQANYYLRRLYISWAATAALCVLIYLLLCALYIFQRRRARGKERKRIEDVAAILSDLTAGEYGALRRNELSEKDSAADILYTRLDSLAEHLRFTGEMAKNEKEATKSLVTDLSHQLKTPVAALSTSLEILEQNDLTEEERREFTTRCLVQKERLKELLDALINISRLESGMIEIRLTKADIFDTVAVAVSRIYPIAARKQIEISVENNEDTETLRIDHDRKWLCEALLNILENAVKYSPENTEIRIGLVKRITFLRIEIEDEGIGIPKESRHLIFQRFFRGSSPEVKEQSGSGVGLYLTRQIIDAHRGTIRVTESSSGGSLFIIQLPYENEKRGRAF